MDIGIDINGSLPQRLPPHRERGGGGEIDSPVTSLPIPNRALSPYCPPPICGGEGGETLGFQERVERGMRAVLGPNGLD